MGSPLSKKYANAFGVKECGFRSPRAIHDFYAVRFAPRERRVEATPALLRRVVATAVRPRERRSTSSRSSAASGDSGSDDCPAEPADPPAPERGPA
jgi:hypothetical protein